MKIFSYVVARDYGFAPNPFHQICTLATCKPKIRCAAKVGDFIVGTSPAPRARNLVFAMQVSEILTYNEYWNDKRFQVKKPHFFGNKKQAFGDNIYSQNVDGFWNQLDSHHTNKDGSRCEKNVCTDTSCRKVLVAERFSYWGSEGPKLPPQLYALVKKGPGHKSNVFSEEFKREAVAWLLGFDKGLHGTPTDWK